MAEQVADIQFEKAPVLICQCRRDVWADTLPERLRGPRVVMRPEAGAHGMALRGECYECGAQYEMTASGVPGVRKAELAAALEAAEL